MVVVERVDLSETGTTGDHVMDTFGAQGPEGHIHLGVSLTTTPT